MIEDAFWMDRLRDASNMGKENTTDAKVETAFTSTALLACPFCGSMETSRYGGSSDLCWIECQKCYASGPVSDRNGADISWNTRIDVNTSSTKNDNQHES